MSANQFPTDLIDLTTNDDGVRSGAPRVLVVHTFEGQDLPIERMMDYQSGRLPHQRTGSYHVVIGADGRSGRENDNEFIPWAAGWTGNRIGLHVCLAGKAAFTREQWLARPKQLATLARWLRHESQTNRIPLAYIDGTRVRAGATGVCGHGDIARAYPDETDHTDPGRGFPFDRVLALAADSPTSTPSSGEPMNAEQSHQLADVTGQLTGSPTPGEFPGWPQLGNRTPVDALAVIGEHLGLPGFYDPRTRK